MAESTELPKSPSTERPLKSIFGVYRGRILLTYFLFNLENLLRLAQPLVLGLAINDLLKSPQEMRGLVMLVIQHLAHLIVGSIRRMYDTRAFTSIYTDLATKLIVDQRGERVDVSRVAARSVLSREYVDFFEMHVPMLIRAFYSVIGALVMISFYDWRLVPICIALLVPSVFLNRIYGVKTLTYSGYMHDQMEKEVQAIEGGDQEQVRKHYQEIAYWRVRLSDAEAINFGLLELFVLGMLGGALILFCNPTVSAGDVFAVFRYLMMFLMGMDSLPKMVHQVNRLRDIGSRLNPGRSRMPQAEPTPES